MLRSLFLSVLLGVLMVATVAAQTTPPQPTNLTATLDPNAIGVRLNWDSPQGQWFFRAYRSVDDTLDFHYIGASQMHEFRDHGAQPGHTYFYYVTAAIMHTGTLTESDPSNIASATIIPPPPPVRGTIAGTVTDDSTSLPIEHIRIRFYRMAGPNTWSGPIVYTDSVGYYEALLDTGTYLIKAEPANFHPPGIPPYQSEWFDNSPDPQGATPVAVTDSSFFTANFGLSPIMPPPPPPRGTIAGTVIDDSTSLPIYHVRIRFYKVSHNTWSTPFTFTDSLGNYQAVLDTGTYLIKAEPGCFFPHSTPPYEPEWYDNSPDPAGATPVTVADSSFFVANFGLSPRVPPSFAYVSGTVSDSLGNPLPHASVAILRSIQEMNYLAAITGTTPGLGNESMELEGVGHTHGVMWRGWTDSLGNYSARVISGRNYVALASKYGYLPQYFDHKSSPTEADIITVSGDTLGIDFDLGLNPELQNSISGVVRDSLGTLVPSRIILFPIRHIPHPNAGRFVHTDSLGAYTIDHVRTGDYFVFAIPFSDYAPAFYELGAYGVRHWEDADTVSISGDVTGIDVGVVPIMSNGITHVGGSIHSTTGAAVEGVNVIALTADNVVAGYTITDANGAYSLEAITSGAVTIVAAREGYDMADRSIAIAPTTYTMNGVDLVLSPASLTTAGTKGDVPREFVLHQNYPNPFNPTTNIDFDVPVQSTVTLKVYNLLGQEIATLFSGNTTAGTHHVVWNGKDNLGGTAASGVYFYRIEASTIPQAQKFVRVQKMLMMK